MPVYEYKVIAAPKRPKKIKGARGAENRYAATLAEAINAVAAEGWEYVRAELLACQDRPGLFRALVELTQTVLVFRRERPVYEARAPEFRITPEALRPVPEYRDPPHLRTPGDPDAEGRPVLRAVDAPAEK